jgi:hypothetical protein
MSNPHELLVPVNGHTQAEMLGTITKSFVSWNRLMPFIKNAVVVKGNEEVIGLEISENGISVIIDYKD